MGNGTALRSYNRAGSSTKDGEINLGASGSRWKNVYATNSSIVTSDRNLKDDICPIGEKYLKFFMFLQPVSFKFKDGTSGRTHVGFISQDVETAMEECGLTNLDFAGFCKDVKVKLRVEQDEKGNIIEIEEPILDDNGNTQHIYSLRYEEFIALNTHMIQTLYDKMSALEQEKEELEGRLKKIEACLGMIYEDK